MTVNNFSAVPGISSRFAFEQALIIALKANASDFAQMLFSFLKLLYCIAKTAEVPSKSPLRANALMTELYVFALGRMHSLPSFLHIVIIPFNIASASWEESRCLDLLQALITCVQSMTSTVERLRRHFFPSLLFLLLLP